MIDYRNIEKIIIRGLEQYFGNIAKIIMANQTAPAPKYPYISYTIITPIVATGGEYGFFNDGNYYKQMNQIWSFTVQSNNQTQCSNIAIMAYDYFNHHGITYLSDNNISVVRTTNITNRDNLLTAEYEYRQGFDVTFGLMNQITPSVEEQLEIIEKGKITAIIDDEEKEINF